MLLEQRQASLSEGRSDMGSVQNGVENLISHHLSQVRSFHTGDWPEATSTMPISQSPSPEPHNVMARTGTDPLTDELDIRTIHSRIHLHNGTQTEGGYAENMQQYDSPPAVSPSISGEYCQFEWSRVLIGMIIMAASLTIAWVIAFYGNIVTMSQQIFEAVGVVLVSLVIYTAFFVNLSQYPKRIYGTLHKYAYLPPRVQKRCLRVCAYVYACACTGTVFSMAGFYYF